MKRYRARQAQERLAEGEARANAGYVFVDEVGHRYRPETFSRMLTKLAATTKLRPLRLHDGRHTAASLMLAAGESPKVVPEIPGHSSPVITQTVYQHLTPSMGEAAGSTSPTTLATRAPASRADIGDSEDLPASAEPFQRSEELDPGLSPGFHIPIQTVEIPSGRFGQDNGGHFKKSPNSAAKLLVAIRMKT